MRDIYRQIFEMAIKEVPQNVFEWADEKVVIYKGFRISKKGDDYFWKDARYNDYFDPVDPVITEKILELGFKKTIIEVMKHTDKDKLLQLKREMERLDAEVKHWIGKSSAAYNKMVSATKKNKNKAESEKKKYEKAKSRFAKKRGVLKSEKEALQADINFLESRIKIYQDGKSRSKTEA